MPSGTYGEKTRRAGGKSFLRTITLREERKRKKTNKLYKEE